MIEKRLIETLAKHETQYKQSEKTVDMLREYAKLVEQGYTRPRGYTLQDLEDRHRNTINFQNRYI